MFGGFCVCFFLHYSGKYCLTKSKSLDNLSRQCIRPMAVMAGILFQLSKVRAHPKDTPRQRLTEEVQALR